MRSATGHPPIWFALLIWSTNLGTPVIAQDSRDGPQPTTKFPTKPTNQPATTPPLKPTLSMSPPVACLRVDGLEQYTVLPNNTLTSADKLKVYFRPIDFQVETDTSKKSPYRARFVEDGQIRRKGEKSLIAKEDKLLEYETRFDAPGYQIYLVNTIGLENLKPGDYELDIILHDMIDGQATAKQTLSFRIVPGPADVPAVPAVEATKPVAPKKAPTKSPRSAKRSG